MKKLLSLALCAALLLCACGKQEAPAPQPTAVPPAPTEEIPSASAETTPPAPKLEEQYACIADHADVWMSDAPANTDYYMYAVTDLDRNGQLEVISSVCRGTGLFSTSKFYEVNADCTGLVSLEYGVPEGDSEPDLMRSFANSYQKEGQYWYVFDDVMHNGYAEQYITRYALCKEGSSIRLERLCSDLCVYTDGETHTYFDTNGKEISAAKFFGAETARFDGWKTVIKSLDWNELTANTNLKAFAESSYWMFDKYDLVGTPDYQLNIYTRPGSAAYESLGIETDFLSGCEFADTVVRFTASSPVQVALEWGEWIDGLNYFHPISDVFNITAEPGVVYEFPALLSEGMPEFRLKVTKLERSNVWYLQQDGRSKDDGIVQLYYEEPQPLLPGSDAPILSLCQAYAGFLAATGSTEVMMEADQFWKAVGNAVLLQTYHNGSYDEYGRVFLPDWLMEAYIRALFPYNLTMPETSEPVYYDPGRYERYMVGAEGLYFDDGSTQIDSVEFDDYDQVVVTVSVWTQIGQKYVVLRLEPDHAAVSSNPFGYSIVSGSISRG